MVLVQVAAAGPVGPPLEHLTTSNIDLALCWYCNNLLGDQAAVAVCIRRSDCLLENGSAVFVGVDNGIAGGTADRSLKMMALRNNNYRHFCWRCCMAVAADGDHIDVVLAACDNYSFDMHYDLPSEAAEVVAAVVVEEEVAVVVPNLFDLSAHWHNTDVQNSDRMLRPNRSVSLRSMRMMKASFSAAVQQYGAKKPFCVPNDLMFANATTTIKNRMKIRNSDK